MKAKVLIVGGGVMGNAIALSSARFFDPLRQPVVLLERSALASGSSGASGAILRQHYADRMIGAMARDSMRTYSSFEGRTGRTLGFQRAGVLTLAGPSRPETIERLERNVDQQTELGIRTQILDAEGVRGLVPNIEVDDGVVAAWEPQGGYVDPGTTVEQFAALARTYGAATRTGVEILSIDVKDGKVVGAETTEGHYDADTIVIVAGAHCRHLLRKLDVEMPLRVARVEQHFFRMPTEDVEDDATALGETSAWSLVDLDDPLVSEGENDPDETMKSMPHPVILDLEYGYYTRCEANHGRTRVCPINYDPQEIYDEPQADSAPRKELADRARELLVKRLPYYADEPMVDEQVSWFPLTPDGRAMIGPVPGVEGAFVAAGFADHGFKLAPSVGDGVAQMIAGEPVSAFDPEYFDPARFLEFDETEDWSGRLYL